jgi:hypothetical protein
MRFATSCVAGMACLLFAASSYATVNTKSASHPVVKDPTSQPVPNPIHINQGGDTIASALPIPSIPFMDTGTTAGYVADYTSTCVYDAGAPDVVYSYSPAADGTFSVSLCGSLYDTGLYVWQDTQGNEVACNDDFCGLQSQVNVPGLAGHTYYIVVDGYSTSSGSYTIDVEPPCQVTCPAGSLLEGEPICGDNYYDSYNGGCNSSPPVFSILPTPTVGHDVTVCGHYGGFLYNGLSYRDTDWYQITLPQAASIGWSVLGEAQTLIGIINGNNGCPISTFYTYTYGTACPTPLSVSASVSAGNWWLWVGTLSFGSAAGPCTQNYTGTASSNLTIAVEPTTWGQVKNMYK